MNVTFNHPGELRLSPEHSIADGRVMVNLDSGGEWNVGVFWLAPQQAAQWIEALTPLAAQQ